MALNTFGGGPNDVTVDANGTTVGGVQLTAWTTKARTQQVTELYAVDGITLLPGYVTSSNEAAPRRGRWVFKAPDLHSVLWMWDGNPANEPWPVAAVEVSQKVGDAITKSDKAVQDAASAVSTANAASSAASAANARSTDAMDTAQAAADEIGSVKAQQDNLVATAPTIDELVQTVVLPSWGTTTSAVESSNVTHTIWIAPFACTLVWAALSFEYLNIPESDTNYWQLQFTRSRDGATADIVSKTTRPLASGGEGVTARRCWDFEGMAWSTANAELLPGDLVLLRTAKTGAPPNIQLPATIVFRYVPA